MHESLLYLSQADVEKINLPMRKIIDTLDEAFKLKGAGKVEMPPKPGIHPLPDAFIHAMPAYIPDMNSAGVKWVSGFPQNQGKGLPYIAGLLILNDSNTGIPISVMDCVWITAMRTGAATAVAAKYLARPDSKTIGILACGVQGRTNLLALDELFDIEHVYAFDTSKDLAEKYAKEMSETIQAKVEVADKPRTAVANRDIVVTAGPILRRPHATIKGGWLSQGTFVSPVDFDSYFAPEAMAQASKFCTDDTNQLLYYQKGGYFQHIPPLHADLGEIASGKKTGREDDDEIIFSANLGLAMDDIAVAPLIYKAAVESDIGTRLPL